MDGFDRTGEPGASVISMSAEEEVRTMGRVALITGARRGPDSVSGCQKTARQGLDEQWAWEDKRGYGPPLDVPAFLSCGRLF